MDTKQYLKEVKELIENLSDEEFLKLLEESYRENGELDKKMAEDLVYVSWEADRMLESE